MALEPGDTLAHYSLRQRLGAGATGEVWLAEDLRLHRQVALKMLKGDPGAEASAAQLVREARVASALTHPNVAVVYEVAEADTPGGAVHFIAMEHVPGRTLAALLAAGRLEPSTILRLTRQIAEAVGIPVVASGGGGKPEDLFAVLTEGKADAALVASMLHYNEYSVNEIKTYLAGRGLKIRIV
jgi:serine/threonine protein kinase